MTRRRLALVVLDGWGERAEREANAIRLATTPNVDQLYRSAATTLLSASGLDVGLPAGVMGNSEVGHLNLGAGRIVYQDIVRISLAIADGSFYANPVLTGFIRALRDHGGRLHLLGLVSDGAVHSLDRHLDALLELARREALKEVLVHVFCDGRDTPPRSALKYVRTLEEVLAAKRVGRIATVSGRYYAMDRDQRWERTEIAFRAVALGEGRVAATAAAAVSEAYALGEGDEFIKPSVVAPGFARMLPADGAFFFNYRADRARQISRALADPAFAAFPRPGYEPVALATMTSYDASFPYPVAFAPVHLSGLMADALTRHGARCLRLSETEKYAHVTYFFNGGVEKPWPGEDRILVASPKVATYDLKPEMSAFEVTDRFVEAIASGVHDAMVVNYPNADMVGHTGDLQATIAAVEAIDLCLGRVVRACVEAEVALYITADHGNAELMVDPVSGEPHTAHTANPVPFFAAAPGMKPSLRSGGRLADVAPTLLDYLYPGDGATAEMSGRTLAT